MDGLTLLAKAHEAGLTVRADGERLVIEGPRQAEGLARKLIEHKSDILAALSVPAPLILQDSRRLWRLSAPPASPAAGAVSLAARVRAAGAVLVGDGNEVVVVARPEWLSSADLAALARLAGQINGLLRREHRERCADGRATVWWAG